MIVSLLLGLQALPLGPTLPVQGKVVARAEPGIPLPLSRLRRILRRCPVEKGSWAQALEIRLVSVATMATFKPTRPDHARRGRYLRASPPHPAMIYIAKGPDLNLSLLHEWLHHQDAVVGRERTEAAIEMAAKACNTKAE